MIWALRLSSEHPLDQHETEIEIAERTAQGLDELGNLRAAAYHRTLAQAKKMQGNETKKVDFMYGINQWVKRRNFNKEKFENAWTGPFVVVEHGFPGTYWLMVFDCPL